MTLLLISVAWIFGIFWGANFDLPSPAVGLFLLAALLSIILLRTIGRPLLPALMLIVLLIGAVRADGLLDAASNSPLLTYHSQGQVKVRGIVSSDPQPAGSATRLRLTVTAVTSGGDTEEVRGDVLVTLRESSELARQREKPFFRYGDLLLLEGKLEAPPSFEDFDYAAYLARQGVSTVMAFPQATLLDEGQGQLFYQWLSSLRRRFSDTLSKSVPEPQASVSQALLLGLRRNLPPDLVDEFNATGTSHLLAISGLHVAILLGIALVIGEALLGRRHRLYLLLPFLMVWLYALISGMSPSVTRAAIIASVYLSGRYLGRPGSILPALGITAAIMVGLDPNILWSVSFQLSFTAVAGIALLGQPIREWLRGAINRFVTEGRLQQGLSVTSDLISISLAATVATYPLIAFYFHRVSLVGIPATLATLPALPAILVSGALTSLSGAISPLLAQPLGWITWAFGSYLTGVVRLFSEVPTASIEIGRVAPLLVWAYYGVLLALVLGIHRRGATWFKLTNLPKMRHRLPGPGRNMPWLLLAPLLAAAVLIWIAAFSAPNDKLKVVFLDVGQGDSIFISAPGGQQILIDGGPDPMGAVRALGERMPFWDRSLDLVVLTHPHEDHVNGLLEVLRRYKVDRVLERHVEYDSPAYAAWQRLIAQEGASIVQAQQGQIVALKGGVTIEVLWPQERLLKSTDSDANNSSVVLRLTYGDISFLLTGDIHERAERLIRSSGQNLDSTVLKVAHQGSKTSSSSEFLEAVEPVAAVILVGEDNRFGHPHKEAVDILLRYVSEDLLLITRDAGDIQFTTNGTRLYAHIEK